MVALSSQVTASHQSHPFMTEVTISIALSPDPEPSDLTMNLGILVLLPDILCYLSDKSFPTYS